ncbi:Calx-beta domain-containing protein [Rudaea cellulosilytica]|uniref:Calx-beta domain-containing protein n=1 Tax=Rudaea cellulosilytica TaxID=540746 RepID=UPI000372541B|nr:Calx-beta domain-containing protein [Rudaea cellulosilytica]
MTAIRFTTLVNPSRDFAGARGAAWSAVFLVAGLANSPLVVATPGDAANFSATSVTVNESAGTVNLTVLRQGVGGGIASVDYSTSNFTAMAPGDYTTTAGTLSWGDGDLTPRTITVPIIDDAIHEGDESFYVALSNPQGLALGILPSEAVVITDNDAAPPAAAVTAPTLGGIASVLLAALLALTARASNRGPSRRS